MTALVWLLLILAIAATLFFSTLTYALRDYSRARLADVLDVKNRAEMLEPTIRHTGDFIFITALFRLLANVLVLLCLLRLYESPDRTGWSHYLLAATTTVLITVFCSVAIPHAIAHHAAEPAIAMFTGMLHGLRIALLPITKLMHAVDRLILKVTGATSGTEPQQIEQEILSVVEEGQKEGVVDAQAREMIESVIEFRDTQVGQIMTPRPEIVALEIHATLAEVRKTLEDSGHSRIPVYDGTLDHIVGVLYARDLLKHLGQSPEQFNIRSAIRPAAFVPETKPLRDLLRDFRRQKVHIAVVADEYGGTAGIVTIEDILKELVGDLGDEHEPAGDTVFRKVSDNVAEADARIPIAVLNQKLALNLSEDADYETLGGFVSVTMGHVPTPGTSFEHENVRYTVIAGEPQRVDRVKIEILPTPAKSEAQAPVKS
jgi:CBS domain containing-hemolysin-like protein